MNKVFLIGRLTRDPELRYTASNIATATFTLAVDRTFTNQDGEREADFINIVVWRKQAENCHNYLSKGSQVAIEGSIRTRNYEGQDGKRVYVTEVFADNVQFLDSKKEKNTSQESTAKKQEQKPAQEDPYADFGRQVALDEYSDITESVDDDGLPF